MKRKKRSRLPQLVIVITLISALGKSGCNSCGPAKPPSPVSANLVILGQVAVDCGYNDWNASTGHQQTVNIKVEGAGSGSGQFQWAANDPNVSNNTYSIQ